MRPGRRERECVEGDLRCALEEGAIGLDTFQTRVVRARRVRSRVRLRRLVGDLSVPRVVAPPPDLAVGESLVIGRHGDASLVLADPRVSRRHLMLRRDADGWTVLDLQSTNGTYVNGWRIRRAHLQPGDELQVGDTCLRIAG